MTSLRARWPWNILCIMIWIIGILIMYHSLSLLCWLPVVFDSLLNNAAKPLINFVNLFISESIYEVLDLSQSLHCIAFEAQGLSCSRNISRYSSMDWSLSA